RPRGDGVRAELAHLTFELRRVVRGDREGDGQAHRQERRCQAIDESDHSGVIPVAVVGQRRARRYRDFRADARDDAGVTDALEHLELAQAGIGLAVTLRAVGRRRDAGAERAVLAEFVRVALAAVRGGRAIRARKRLFEREDAGELEIVPWRELSL